MEAPTTTSEVPSVKTSIVFILDRSGSMQDCRSDTIGGFNAFIEEQKKVKADVCTMTLVQFDHEILTVFEDRPIAEVVELTTETFVPRGNTALLDAIGTTIKVTDAKKLDGNIVFAIMTDGHENASRTYTSPHIKDLITEREKGNWSFVFLAANQDAITSAAHLGIHMESACTFSTDKAREQCTVLSGAITKTRGITGAKVAFTPEDRGKTQ